MREKCNRRLTDFTKYYIGRISRPEPTRLSTFSVDFYLNEARRRGEERVGVYFKNVMFGEFRLILTLSKLGILGIHLSHSTLCKLYES